MPIPLFLRYLFKNYFYEVRKGNHHSTYLVTVKRNKLSAYELYDLLGYKQIISVEIKNDFFVFEVKLDNGDIK